MNLFDEASV
jgi:hypothetical protein